MVRLPHLRRHRRRRIDAETERSALGLLGAIIAGLIIWAIVITILFAAFG